MIYHILRYLYTGVLWLMMPWIFLRLWVRGLNVPACRDRWSERLGYLPFPPLTQAIWVHAVSVGESIAAITLVKALTKVSHDPILITTTTPTGSERIQAAFKDQLGQKIFHAYLPYDYPFAISRFFSRLQPKLAILMETELWPNLLYACEMRHIPILIANARLSPTSFKRYSWLKSFMARMMRPIHVVAAQSALDKERFHHLGVPLEKISETGNIKFDLQLPAYLTEAGSNFRKELGQERLVFVAASTHDQEEAMMLTVYERLKQQFPQLLLLLVPRHPDRFQKVAKLCLDRGFKLIKRSDKRPCEADTDVFLGDSMGEMPLYYAASDVAFVGGSFVPIGGHNLLEPAALGLPVLTGPHTFNFIHVTALLTTAKGATIVADEQALQDALSWLLSDATRREAQGVLAKQVVAQNKGALDKLIMLIDQAAVGHITCHSQP